MFFPPVGHERISDLSIIRHKIEKMVQRVRILLSNFFLIK